MRRFPAGRLLPWWIVLSSVARLLGAEELEIRFERAAIEVRGVTPGAVVTLVGVVRGEAGLDFDRMREWLRDGDGDGRVRLELSSDLPVCVVAAVEAGTGRKGTASRGVRWATELGVLREHGVDVFKLRPGGGEWSARLEEADLDPAKRGGPPLRGSGLEEVYDLEPGDVVFAVDLTSLRSVLFGIPREAPAQIDPGGVDAPRPAPSASGLGRSEGSPRLRSPEP